jgi:hypothetical protein
MQGHMMQAVGYTIFALIFGGIFALFLANAILASVVMPSQPAG